MDTDTDVPNISNGFTDQQQLKRTQNRVKALQKRPQPEQRTPEWFQARHTRVTASEAASCLYRSKTTCEEFVKQFGITNFRYKDTEGLNGYETREDYIIKKCAAFYGENVFRDSVHTLWGKKYEEVANRLYCQLYDTTVIEFGLISHSRLKWLAASPDGITPNGIMLEIKCPKSRKIDTTQIPIYYWVQTQIQMECVDLDFCDFLECEIEELETEEQFINTELIGPQAKGIVLKYDSETERYIYPPVHITEPQDYIDWKNTTIAECTTDTLTPTYFVVTKYNIQRIPRSKTWFQNVKNDIKRTWDTIMHLQSSREYFDKYKQSIHMIRSKNFYERFHSTECEIHDDISTFVFDESSVEASEDQQVQGDQQVQPEQKVQPDQQVQLEQPEQKVQPEQQPQRDVVCLID